MYIVLQLLKCRAWKSQATSSAEPCRTTGLLPEKKVMIETYFKFCSIILIDKHLSFLPQRMSNLYKKDQF